MYGANLDAHHLLLIDDRGRGLSDAIDCEGLQHGTTPFDQAEGDCATQLGPAASRYGTGDKTAKATGLDRKTIRRILNGGKVKASTLAKAAISQASEFSSGRMMES